MPSSAAVLSLLLFSLTELPSAPFNLPVQHRTRTCVEMKGDVIALRFADGTPTGFWAHANDPSQQGSAEACAPGTMEIDAHETLESADKMTTYFHPGGGPDQYSNYLETGQYGHIAREDLKGRVKLDRTPNGKTAPAKKESARTYHVTPTRIPMDMWYKPNVSAGKSGSRYFTYGNPGYDKTGGRGDWTYINWSWVQNGGRVYPANKTDGGGIARALLKRGMRLTACDVEPVIGYSYGPDNQTNGRVTAFYARAFVGPGESGSAIHGWLPHSYQRNNDVIIPCVRRTDDAPETALPVASLKSAETDPMARMATNLLYELKTDQATGKTLLADWGKKYAAEKNAVARMEILSEMSRLDRPETVTVMLRMLAWDQDAAVREQAILILGFMRSTMPEIAKVCPAMLKAFQSSKSERERLRILEIMSNLPCPEAVQLVRDIVPTLEKDVENVELQVGAADAVLKLSEQTPVDEALLKEAMEPLKQHAKSARSRGLRARMIRLLAAPGRRQLPFLLELLKTERSDNVKETLTEVTANLQLARNQSAESAN